MRKVKLLPSVLMLVLCVGILAIGVYAAAPVSHSIQGTINVSAAGANVKITAYLDKTGNGYSNDDTIISNDGNGNNYLETRTNGTLNINTNALDFTEANMDAKEYTKNVILQIENKSSIALGAYFPVGTGTTSATAGDLASVKYLDGTSTSGTIADVVRCDFGPYTEIRANSTSYLTLDLSLAKLSHFEAVTVAIDLTLNLENYNANLAEVDGVNVYTNNQNVAISSAVSHGKILNTAQTLTQVVSGYRYTTENVTLDSATYPNSWSVGTTKKHETTKVAFTITNNGTNAISADVSSDFTRTGVEVVGINNSYIPAGGTGEVSLQLAITDDATISDYSLSDLNCKISVYEATSDTQAIANIQSRIKEASASEMVGSMKYYIEYGVNPYKNNTPLRWFIWAKDNGSGTAVALGDTNPTTAAGTYYFISEYVLDTTASSYGISYQNTFDSNWTYNMYYYNNKTDADTNSSAFYASDYAGSNYRDYVNGLTTKRSCDTSSEGIADGANVNFYDTFGLTSDPLFTQITARSISELYSNDSYKNADPASMYEGQADKFWALSYSEYEMMRGTYDDETYTYPNAVAYNLPKASSTNSSSSWWLRSPYNDYSE